MGWRRATCRHHAANPGNLGTVVHCGTLGTRNVVKLVAEYARPEVRAQNNAKLASVARSERARMDSELRVS